MSAPSPTPPPPKHATAPLTFLQAYPQEIQAQVRGLLTRGHLGDWLKGKYAQAHTVRTDRALYDYLQTLKQEYLRGADPVNKVVFDSKLHVVHHALGTHTTVSRVQGTKLKAKREIRIASLFKDAPPEFLKMIVVHELAHVRERSHDKAFYQLCSYMEPAYHQLEFDLRVYLTHLNAGGSQLWGQTVEPLSQTGVD